jgi:hypothetical protein
MSFLQQALVALVLSLTGAAMIAVGAGLKLVIALVSTAYVFYLLWQSRQRIGRVVIGAAIIAVTSMGFLWLEASIFLLSQLSIVWFVRSLYFHSRPLACLADLGLMSVSCAVAVWVFATGSVFLTFWSFFLVQALFVWLPGRQTRDDVDINDAFGDAKRTADSALQSLLARN